MGEWKQDLTDKIKKRKAVLVLGQAYLSLVGTTIDDFVDPLLMKMEVQVSKKEARNLAHIYQLLLDRGYSKDNILAGLHLVCESLELSENIQRLVQLPWRAIFLSGIDDIVSRAIRKHVPARQLRTVYGPDTRFSERRNPTNYYTVWLEGCINQKAAQMLPAITQDQRIRRRTVVRELLGEMSRFTESDGIVVLAGFDPSAEERKLVSTLIDVIEDDLKTTPSYWFPDNPEQRSHNLFKLEEDGKLVIVRDETFQNYLSELPKGLTESCITDEDLTVKTQHGSVVLTERENRLFSQRFVVLTKGILQVSPLSGENKEERYHGFRDFLNGVPWPKWQYLASDFVFRRNVFTHWNKEIIKELSVGKSIDNTAIPILSPSGTGKTVCLQYLAWEIAKQGYPVIYIPQTPEEPNFEVIRRFCEAVQPKEKTTEGSKERVLIAWDSSAGTAKQYSNLSRWLQAKGVPALIVGTAYRREISNVLPPINDDEEEVWDGKHFDLPLSLTDDEAGAFVDFLKGIDENLLQCIPDVKKFIKVLKQDLFLALYDYLPQTRSSLTRGVRRELKTYEEDVADRVALLIKDDDENDADQSPAQGHSNLTYGLQEHLEKHEEILAQRGLHVAREEVKTDIKKSKKIHKKWRRLLRLVTVASQYNCNPSLDLVLRTLGQEEGKPLYNSWVEERQCDQYDGILKQFEDKGTLLLGMRNSRIAQIAVQALTVNQRLESVKQLLMASRVNDDGEREFIKKWVLAMRYPSYARGKALDMEQDGRIKMIQIYEEFLKEKGEVPLVIHQLARLQRLYAGENLGEKEYKRKEEYFNIALENFERALSAQEKEDPLYRSRERQNIINSIASVHRDIVKNRLNRMNSVDPEECGLLESLRKKNRDDLLEVKEYCQKGRLGNRPSPYPYDVEVTSLLNLFNLDSTIQNDSAKKADLFAQMILLLDQAEQNFEDSELGSLISTRIYVERLLGDKFEDHTVKRLAENGNMDGYYLSARQVAYRYDNRRVSPNGMSQVKEAYDYLRDGLNKYPSEKAARCWFLLGQLWWHKSVGLEKYQVGRDLGLTVSLSKEQWKDYFTILESQRVAEGSAGVSNLYLQFMLGWSLFQMGMYQDGLEQFHNLERLSQGSPLRIKTLAKVTDQEGKEKVFHGEIAELRDMAHGMAYFPSQRIRVPFNPKQFESSPKPRDTKEFIFHLNHRGVFAHPA